MTLLLPLIPGLPLMLGVLLSLVPRQHAGKPPAIAGMLAVAVLTSVMALLVAAFGAGPLHLDWLLLGMRFQVDALSRGLLAVAGILWMAAAVSALPVFRGANGRRFAVCFLLTLAGNLGVLVVQDVAGFYLWYALMTFAAYGLVVHDGTAQARRAGRVYLWLAVAGEALLLAGLFSLAAHGGLTGNPLSAQLPAIYQQLAYPELTAGLILAGFAVKVGVVPLHVWLPLAHPAAPVAASAVLSGIILKAGLMGWLRLLPGEAMMLPGPGRVLIVLGVAGALLAALVGCFQSRPKTVLAYSSVSQMGLLSVLVGLWLAGDAGQAAALEAAILLFAVHHGLAKGALFLAMDPLKSNALWPRLAVLVPVLAIAGAPLSSGLVAKAALKAMSSDDLLIWITLSSVTTSLLLLRFLALIWPRSHRHVPRSNPSNPSNPWPTPWPALLAWLGLVASSSILPWWLADAALRAYALRAGSLVDALWPMLLALLLAALAARMLRVWPRLPEGDVLLPATRAGLGLSRCLGGVMAHLRGGAAPVHLPVFRALQQWLAPPELGLVAAALALLATTLLLMWLL